MIDNFEKERYAPEMFDFRYEKSQDIAGIRKVHESAFERRYNHNIPILYLPSHFSLLRPGIFSSPVSGCHCPRYSVLIRYIRDVAGRAGFSIFLRLRHHAVAHRTHGGFMGPSKNRIRFLNSGRCRICGNGPCPEFSGGHLGTDSRRYRRLHRLRLQLQTAV